jgi:hypothetical protein
MNIRGRPFEAGNKMGRGRRPGSRNKRTLFAEMMEGHGEAIIKQCQILAMKGDPTALKLCIERLVAPCKSASSRFRLPPLGTLSDLLKAMPSIIQEVARGRLSAQEGEAIASMLDSQRRALETQEFDARLKAIEQNMSGAPSPDKGR